MLSIPSEKTLASFQSNVIGTFNVLEAARLEKVTMQEYLAVIYQNQSKPELEIYDAGMINNIAFSIEGGYVRKPVYLQFVMGILGGIPATPQNLIFLVESAKNAIGDFEFSVCAAGKMQFRLCTQSLMLGGHARLGLEDNSTSTKE